MNYFPARKCLHRYLKVAVCKKSRLSCGKPESTSITQELLVRSEVRSTNSATKLLRFSTRSTVGKSYSPTAGIASPNNRPIVGSTLTWRRLFYHFCKNQHIRQKDSYQDYFSVCRRKLAMICLGVLMRKPEWFVICMTRVSAVPCVFHLIMARICFDNDLHLLCNHLEENW